MKRLFLSLPLLAAASALAQTATIAANSLTFTATINGTTVTIVGPSTAVIVPVTGVSTAGLPSGITYANNVLTVAGSISTGTLALTGGSALPSCASASYLLSPVSSGSTTLQPTCYVPPAIPAISVSQATSPINTFTFTP